MFTIKTILCPVDFSDASAKALRYSREFALNMGASLVLLNVVEPRPMAVDMSLNYVPLEDDVLRAAADELQGMVDALSAEGLSVEQVVAVGNPPDVILDKAAEVQASMIILGSHGKTGLSRFIMGSVAEVVVRKAHCPVLTVKVDETDFIAGADPDAEMPQ